MANERDSSGNDDVSLLLQGMCQMQKELKVMSQVQEATSQQLALQAHRESYSVKKKGNECQVKANQQVMDRSQMTSTRDNP